MKKIFLILGILILPNIALACGGGFLAHHHWMIIPPTVLLVLECLVFWKLHQETNVAVKQKIVTVHTNTAFSLFVVGAAVSPFLYLIYTINQL